MWVGVVVGFSGWVLALVGLIGDRFGRVEPRQRVGAYLRGLLAGLERKNGWTLAEYAGAVSPDGMQRLLRTAGWDVEGVRDDLRGYVLEHLGGTEGVRKARNYFTAVLHGSEGGALATTDSLGALVLMTRGPTGAA